jgi:peptidase A4-like protein
MPGRIRFNRVKTGESMLASPLTPPYVEKTSRSDHRQRRQWSKVAWPSRTTTRFLIGAVLSASLLATWGVLPAAATTVQNPWAAVVYVHSANVVSAQVIVPTLACQPTSAASLATWVGLDGWTNNTVEQVGFTFACDDGHQSNGAWYQMYPAPAVALNVAIRAGDKVDLLEQWDGSDLFISTVTDTTASHSVGVTARDPAAQRSSAECVTEYDGYPIPAARVSFPSCVANRTVGLPGNHQEAVNIEINGGVHSSEHMTSSTAFYQSFTAS